MNNSSKDDTELAQQLRRLAAAQQEEQQYRDSRAIEQSTLPASNPAHVYARQSGEMEDCPAVPATVPGAGFDAAELLRQMAQLPQGQQPAVVVDYPPGQQHRPQQVAVSQPSDEHGIRREPWPRQGQTLQDLISYLPPNMIRDFPREQGMQRDLQRLASSGATQPATNHALSEMHGQQGPQAPVGHFMNTSPALPNPGSWQEGIDGATMDMRAASTGGFRSGSVSGSLDRRESAQHGPVDAGFAAAVPPAVPRVPQGVHAQPQQAPAPQPAQDMPLAPKAPQLSAGKGTVLAAKMLTESDVKHSRAILPRVAVENNLPFLLGYRTFGMYLPDEEGTSWEFVVKSWANGRSDKTGATPRRKDRRVYVVEQMASFLAKHHLNVGDVVGIVHVNGHLEMHCQTHALKAWIERPTYGAPPLDTFPTPVPGKCSLLEDAHGDAAARRGSKPDRPTAYGDGTADGPRMPTNLVATFKLKLWPQPSCADPPAQPDVATLPELEPAHLLEGPLVTFRVTQAMLDTGVVEMPAGHVVKVPEHLCEAPAIRVQVQFAPGSTHTIVFTAQPRSEAQQATVGATPGDAPAADVPAPVEAPGDVAAVPNVPPAVSASPGALPSSSPALPSTSAMASPALPSPGPISAGGPIPSPSALPPHGGGPPFTPGKGPLFPTDSGAAPGPLPSELRGWHISGLTEVLQTVGCNVADELCIEKSETIVVHRLSSTHLPPLPASVQPVTPPLPGTFAMNLCQRTQGCMKNENHTGFCSGHRGFKRKNTTGQGEEGAGGQRRKSGGKGKGRGVEAKVDAAGHGGIPPVVDARFLQHDGSGMLLQQFHSGVPPPGGRGPQRTKPELSAAADVLLQMSGTPSCNMPTSLAPSEQLVMPSLQRVTEEGQWQTAEGRMAARAATCHAMPLSQLPLQDTEQGIAAEQQNAGFLDALLQNASEFAQHHRPPS